MKNRGISDQRPSPAVDLRSDVITPPTDAMWQAMRDTSLGWALTGEDPSVQRLETAAAELTGKEAALFVPTGTMANLVALMTHTRRGDQVILENSSHILWSEEGGFAAICGLVPRPIDGFRGALNPDDVRHAIRGQRASHRPHTSLICLENTHNMAGGTVVTPVQIEAVAAVAAEHGAALHLDGARLFNAAVALGIPVRALTAAVDTVMLSLSKGLSAPNGALLCGSGALVKEGRLNLKRLGGASIHKAGLAAAAGLVALQNMIPRLAEDHRRARRLACQLSELEGIYVDLESVQTNIVMASIDEGIMPAAQLVQAMEARGVKVLHYSHNTVRFVTHREITDEHIDSVIQVVSQIIRNRRQR